MADQPLMKFQSLRPWLVSFAATLWATDAIFRSQLTAQFSPIFIVLLTHILCFPVSLSTVIAFREQVFKFKASELFALIILSLGGSVAAMIFFTYSFAMTSNYNVPILLQKLQPLFAIFLARLFLKEKPSRSFYLLAALAMTGGYLISFGDQNSFVTLKDSRLQTMLFALAAAAIWGACTVAGRHFMKRHDPLVVTMSRYFLATICLFAVALFNGDFSQFSQVELPQLKTFMAMAYVPGLLALYIYYTGLKGTPASVATIGELSFPLAAVFINWYFLDSPLKWAQIAGALLLVGSTTLIHFNHQLLKTARTVAAKITP